jgi:rubredoxin
MGAGLLENNPEERWTPVKMKGENQMASTPQHCPGFTNFKNLRSFVCTCPQCGAKKEIFSDEFDRAHACNGCGKAIDFNQCTLAGSASSPEPA